MKAKQIHNNKETFFNVFATNYINIFNIFSFSFTLKRFGRIDRYRNAPIAILFVWREANILFAEIIECFNNESTQHIAFKQAKETLYRFE